MARGKLNRGGQGARQVRVGIVAVLALLFLAYGIFQVGRLFDVFASRYALVTLVQSSAGLIEGAPVTIAGQRVGQVDRIEFIPVETRSGGHNIRLELSISEGVREQIREDSRATLLTQGLLGDRYVDIAPGSPGFDILDPGDTIPSVPPLDYEQVLRTASNTLDQVQTVIGDLEILTARLAAGEGTLGALLTDDRLYQRMTVATEELAGLLGTINRSDGTLSRLIRDPTVYNRVDQALARLDSLGGAILAGEGSLGRLVRDDSLYRGLVGVVERADSALGGVETFVEGVNQGDGALARLIEDPALYDQFLKTVVDLQALIEAIRTNPEAFSPEIRVDVF